MSRLAASFFATLEYLLLLIDLVCTAVRRGSDLVTDNLLRRQQLASLARATRKRPRLRAREKLFWVPVRAVRRDWRPHLVLVRPDTVFR